MKTVDKIRKGTGTIRGDEKLLCAIRLRDVEGLSFAEIGERCGVSHQWARKVYAQAKEKFGDTKP